MTKNKSSVFTIFGLVVLGITIVCSAEAGQKPLNNPPEVTEWFRNATINRPALERLLIEIQLVPNFRMPDRPLTEADKGWMNLARTTVESRKRLGINMTSCCNHGDRVKTKFNVDRSSGADRWSYLDPISGQWKDIPPDIIHDGDDDPSVPRMPLALRNEGVLFIYKAWDGVFKETCFWPPRDGG